jgi:hypothetical protein
MIENLNSLSEGIENQEWGDRSTPSDVWISRETLRQYILASRQVQSLDAAIAAQFNAKLGELWEYNVVSLVKFLRDLHLNSLRDLDALLQFNFGRILQVADVERSAFQSMVPRGFSLFILSYIVAAKRLRTEVALEVWLDSHFTGHAMERRSFARRLLSATMEKGESTEGGPPLPEADT